MYAFALFDRKLNFLHLGRDYYGQKPLYYYHSPDLFAFSSLLKDCLRLSTIKPRINVKTAHHGIQFGMSLLPESLFEGIFEVPPGNLLKCCLHDSFSIIKSHINLKSEIKLNSGGYLVINPTEALVSIDINSGSSIKGKNVESTALDTNIEAAEEIARQIKIRDLSGLIIIDFIDMLSYGNRRLVERKLKEKCRSDRARIQIGRISNFGLLEMSRQRLRESAIKWKVTLTDESFAQKLLKIVELKAVINKAKFVELKVCEKVSDFLKENFVDDLTYFEKKNKIKIDIISDNSLIIPEYIIDIKNKSKKTVELVEYYEKLKNLEIQNKENKFLEKKENKKINKKTYKKKRYYKKTK